MKERIFYKIRFLIFLGLFILSQQSCYQKFFKATAATAYASPASIIREQTGKYFILRLGTNGYHMENIVIDSSDKSMKFTLSSLPEDHALYIAVHQKKGISYQRGVGEDNVLNEVHVYVTADADIKYLDSCQLLFTEISKIEVIEQDKDKTSLSSVNSTIAIIISIILIFAGLVVAAN